jgi:hypothetical protein
MTDSLRTTKDRLRRELAAGTNTAFETARARRPELAPFASILDVLEALDSGSAAGEERRHAIVAELVREHRASKSAVWSKALLVAFYPAMHALRARLTLGSISVDDIDQTILTGFVGAVAELPARALGHFAAFRICRRMERYVFKFLLRERGFRRITSTAGEDEDFTAPHTVGRAAIAMADERIALGFLLRRATTLGLSPATVELIEATAFAGTSLRAYVRQLEPDDADARKRLYERLKRRRSRALRRLRALVDVPELHHPKPVQVHDDALE